MSAFFCGELVFAAPTSLTAQDALAARLVRAALDERLGVQLGAAVAQPLVFTLLGRSPALDEARLAFLVTDGPIWDVTEELLDAIGAAPLAERLARLERWLTRALDEPAVARVEAVVCEGSDDHFEEHRLPVGALARLLAPRLETGHVPSLRLRLTRA